MHKEKAKTLLNIIKKRSVCYKKLFEGLIKVHVFNHRRFIQLCESINHHMKEKEEEEMMTGGGVGQTKRKRKKE
jgi:hypothetical protein